jgi:O-acetylhomoserine/O-acetylserine sulfhydrylase-like pyridoxal-dependent enzyme
MYLLLLEQELHLLRDLGAALAPDNAFGIIQGLETVALEDETALLKRIKNSGSIYLIIKKLLE